MKHICFYIIVTIFGISCAKSHVKRIEKLDQINSDHLNCTNIIDDNLIFLQNANEFYNSDYLINNQVALSKLINCCLEGENIRKENIKSTLLKYSRLYVEDRIKQNIHPTFFSKSDFIGRILTEINNKESFKIHLKIFSYNKCDKPGHGIETSTGVGYFEYMMLPLISTINGVNAHEFYNQYKMESFFSNSINDCDLQYYNNLYTLVKDSWEDGKIVLKTDQIKTDK